MSFKRRLRKIGLQVALGSIRKLETNTKHSAALCRNTADKEQSRLSGRSMRQAITCPAR